ncbi:oxysterol-binding protein-related protein 9-like isoform X2 [Convolutriloba macropyga]|uniref:oxysterol-binding protein-related protein 9-like isoform X2 n=1 Tax=Convolutriloba macropyga TaxID=536237 RepID=UPI003F52893C
MPLGADKASNKKWGLRRLSLTKSNFSKQSSIDSSGAPAQVANNEKILVPSSPKEKEALNGTGEQIENVPPDIKDSRDQWSDDEEEELDITGHQTVLKHLAQQVKVGMDLTRVTLPTFILEKRSLLEMYADFFAHPEFFVLTTGESNPKLRFMYIVKWYLSSFHTGRKGAVAKKPFNPILGEIFRCHWKLPTTIVQSFSDNLLPKCDSAELSCLDNNNKAADTNGATSYADDPQHVDRLLTDSGPVPWSCSTDATFVAEQVSHHPPISAFYAECISKKVEVNGYIHPKSKFMGLSIGVTMIGEAKVKLLERNETYTVNFPNGFGRSILTVPWSELGGKCVISCDSSGYKAVINFHTKNFYSKDRHLITCECYDPSGNKFCVIKGQWNDKMYIMSPGQKTSSDVFLDTAAMKVNKKQVKPLSEQSENESRKLWRHVISGLRAKDLDAATNEKKKLEEKQRNDARIRQESGHTWTTLDFDEDGEGGYKYKSPLSERLKTVLGATASTTANGSSTCSEVD